MKKSIKIICATLALCIVTGAVGTAAFAAGAKSVAPTNETATTEKNESEAGLLSNFKDETVYVIATADGTPKKVIVSDWIKNNAADKILTDDSQLEDVKNVKGEQSFTLDENNMRRWNADGSDIYSQGTSDKALPVALSVRYYLDGKAISPDALAGKSGKVTMRFDYDNRQYEYVSIDGKKTKIYVPFVMLTGMLLDNDSFSDISVTNGRMINDGDRTAVVGFALPGMQQNLDLDRDKLEIPDYVEISANVTNFELTTTLTLATNDVFNELDSSKLDSTSELESKLDELTDAVKSLTDGSSQLYSGLATLLTKSDELISGVDKLADGAAQLQNGTLQLQSGTAALSDGLALLCGSNDKLCGGAKQVFDTLLNTSTTQLHAAGLDIPALTVDNYEQTLQALLKTLDPDAVKRLAEDTAKKTVTEQVNANTELIKAAVTLAVREKVLEGVLDAAKIDMNAQQYNQAVTAGLIPESTQQQIAGAVELQLQTQTVAAQIEQNTAMKIQSLIDENMKSNEVTERINEAVEKAKAGAVSVKTLLAQLDSYNEFYNGITEYTSAVRTAADGAQTAAIGAKSLNNGANTLKNGLASLQSGTGVLKDGVEKLADGALQLSDGMSQLNQKGVSKLVLATNDLRPLVNRLKATIDVSKDYKTYSGDGKTLDGKVKFIYRTEEISK